jgi:hypothetical protein
VSDERPDFESQSANVSAAVNKAREAHEHNHKLFILAVSFLGGFGVISVVLVEALNLATYTVGFVVVGVVSMMVFMLQNRIIPVERAAIEPLVQARSLILELEKETSEPGVQKKAVESLISSGDILQLPTGGLLVESILARRAGELVDNVALAVKKRLSYQLEVAKGKDEFLLARRNIEDLILALVPPDTARLNRFLDATTALKDRPPHKRQIQWKQLPENRLGQIGLAVVGAVIIPPIVVVFYAFVLGIPMDQYLRGNPDLLITGFLVTFAGLLAWLRQK